MSAVERKPRGRAKSTAEQLRSLKKKVIEEQIPPRLKEEFGIVEDDIGKEEEEPLNFDEQSQNAQDKGDVQDTWDGNLESFDFTEDLPVPKTDDAMIATAKLFKCKGTTHHRLFQFSDKETPCEYPLKSNKKCLACKRRFDTVPVFEVTSYDEKSDKPWKLDPYAHCSLVCVVETVMGKRKANVAQRLGLLWRFTREFFGIEANSIQYVSIGCVEGFCDDPIMTEEEYYKCIGTISVMIRQPPFIFVDTWSEKTDAANEKQRQKEFEKLLNTKSTPEQQSSYKNTIKRIMNEQQNKNQSLENTIVGKTMGIKVNK